MYYILDIFLLNPSYKLTVEGVEWV